MRKRILALLLCSAVAVSGLTSCGQDEKTAVTTPEATQQSSGISDKTMKPPESGWTMEELFSHTYLCGKQLSYPLTIGSLGDGFEIGEGTATVGEKDGEKRVDAELWFNKEYLGGISLDAGSVEEVNGETQINYLFIDQYSDVYENSDGNIEVNGISIGDSKDDLIGSLGTPTKDNEEMFSCIYEMHNDPGAELWINFDNNNNVTGYIFQNISRKGL